MLHKGKKCFLTRLGTDMELAHYASRQHTRHAEAMSLRGDAVLESRLLLFASQTSRDTVALGELILRLGGAPHVSKRPIEYCETLGQMLYADFAGEDDAARRLDVRRRQAIHIGRPGVAFKLLALCAAAEERAAQLHEILNDHIQNCDVCISKGRITTHDRRTIPN